MRHSGRASYDFSQHPSWLFTTPTTPQKGLPTKTHSLWVKLTPPKKRAASALFKVPKL